MMYLVTFNFTDVLLLLFGIFVGLIWGAFIFVKRKRNLIMKRINKGFTNIDEEKVEIPDWDLTPPFETIDRSEM